jgi:Icc-related predicted phosphoesterase
MLLVADVHGAVEALARVAAAGEPLLVLGDLINYIDYRSNEGIVAEVGGEAFTKRVVDARTAGDFAEAGRLWRDFSAGREDELRADFDRRVHDAYHDICAALEGADAYVTFGNVDRPRMLADHLPEGARFVEAGVFEIEGLRVGFAGGGVMTINTPGEVSDERMEANLRSLGPVDILCTHVAPAMAPLSQDVIGGRRKGSRPLAEYLREVQPPFHYFGDIHQPQAVSWRIGSTISRNVGYFRATGRAVRHPG